MLLGVAQCDVRTDGIVAMRRCSATCALPFEASAAARQDHPATFLSSRAGSTLFCPETLLQCERRSEAIVALRRSSRTCALPFKASAAARHAYTVTFCSTLANLTLSCSGTVAHSKLRTVAIVAMRRCSATCALPFEASAAARQDHPATFLCSHARFTLSFPETLPQCEHRSAAIVAVRRCSRTCALPFEASAAARHACPATCRSTLANLTLCCSETVAQCDLRTEGIVAMRHCSATCALLFEASAAARQDHPATFLSSRAGSTLSCPETLLQCEHRSEAIVALRRWSRTCVLPFKASVAARHAYPVTFCSTLANLTLSCSETVAHCELRTVAIVAMRRCLATCALPFEASAAARHAYPATFRTTLANLTLSCSETVAQCELRTEAMVAIRRCSATCALPFEASAVARQDHPATFLSSHAGFTLSCPETLLQCEHRSEAIVALRRCSSTCALPF